MSDDFSTMSAADLEVLKAKATKSLAVIAEATGLKSQSTAVLYGFLKVIEDLSKARVCTEKRKECRPDAYEKWYLSLVPQSSELTAPFERVLTKLGSAYGDAGPFGAVPMHKFWAEWSEAVVNLTALMVNRYAAKYVLPIPIDTVENIEAYKVGEKIAEAAEPGVPAQ
jgi:hypothetical protein